MNNEVKELTPRLLWKHFSNLCMVPRPSKKELGAVEFVKNFAIEMGLEYTVDHVNNIIIRKPATPGMENRPGVILQAHLDMVPQKNNDVRHDFEKDPISAYVDGDWVKARGTTLGADNGIGVAAAMAVLESKEIKHGPLEALFTIDEEAGMTGAHELKPGLLNGSVFLNLDSEEEGELYIGCAGGINATVSIPYSTEPTGKSGSGFRVSLTGLKGGHSGLDINLGRGNANKLLNRFLWNASRQYGLKVASIDGGNMRNAIPREATADVVIPSGKEEVFLKDLATYLDTIRTELFGVETETALEAVPTGLPATVMSQSSQKTILDVIYALPNGAMRMIADKPEVVETSTNLAIVKSDGKNVNIACLLRSSVDSAKEDLCRAMAALYELAGCKIELSGSYPGWRPNFDSAILKTMKDVYLRLYNREPEVKVIHAGLECAIFGESYPGMDYISFGPTIMHPHSPGEKVNIPSVGKFWDFLLETLKSV